MEFASENGENITGKGENTGFQQFPTFLTVFSKVFLLWVLKTNIYGKDELFATQSHLFKNLKKKLFENIP